MSKLSKASEALAQEWMNLDPLLRDEILRCARIMHEAMRDAANAVPAPLMEAAQKVAGACLAPLLLGKSVEEIVVEACAGIPELSPYIRQMMGE